ncbi:MAG: Flp family type IVb pilin [Rhizobiaceae bacterium]|nr:Flp family type IVb pilin [Rhizobiaceae bacterium]
MLKRFVKDIAGASAVEYGLIVAVLSMAVVGGVGMFSNSLENMFDYQAGIISNAAANLD